MLWKRLDIGRRVTREGHAWFWECLRVKVPRGRTIKTSCFPPFGKDRFGIPKPPWRAWDCKNTGTTGLDLGRVKTCTDEKPLESFFLGQLGMSFIGTPLGTQTAA